MERLLTEQEANYLYRRMLIAFTETNDVEDKLNKLRATFDTTLSFAVMNKVKKGEVPSEYYGFMAKIDLLFPKDSADRRVQELRSLLHQQREELNTGVAHVAQIEQQRLMGLKVKGLNSDDYRSFLNNTANLIATLSSLPIPEKLQQAIRPRRRVTMTSTLDIVILLQLYSNLNDIDDGFFILQRLREWINEKKKWGLEMARVSLVTYSGNLSELSGITSLRDLQKKALGATTGTDEGSALSQALQLCSKGIDRYTAAASGVMKPWLIWICHGLPENLPQQPVDQLDQWLDMQLLTFHPLPTQSDAFDRFLQLWPSCKPQQLVPRLASNLFSSITETIQRHQQVKNQ